VVVDRAVIEPETMVVSQNIFPATVCDRFRSELLGVSFRFTARHSLCSTVTVDLLLIVISSSLPGFYSLSPGIVHNVRVGCQEPI